MNVDGCRSDIMFFFSCAGSFLQHILNRTGGPPFGPASQAVKRGERITNTPNERWAAARNEQPASGVADDI